MKFRSGRSTTLAFNGLIATPHYLASAAGLQALEAGGSAMDAAIAANAVLTVVYPDQTSIGGDCFFLAWDAGKGSLSGFNGSGRAPMAADRQALRANHNEWMPFRGIHSVTVPGTIDAWMEGHQRFGRLPFGQLLQPAVRHARHGFPVTPNLHRSLTSIADNPDFDAGFRRIYLPEGVPPAVGSRLFLPALAASLEAIAANGRAVFYAGEIGEAIVATSEALGGRFVADDLRQHQGEWVEPVTSDYHGVTVAEIPPNSQGITALIELNMVELEPVAEWGTPDHLHVAIEAKKRAFTVRDQQLADPAFVDIDVERLTSKGFAAELWRDFSPAVASDGQIDQAGDTVYLCCVDGEGNAVSLIQSTYLPFGSGVIAGETGIVLQCRGAYFSLDDNHVNRLEGAKRPLHTLMPGMLLRDGQLWGPFGTQGGDAQAQVNLQLVMNLVDYGMDPQLALDAPRWVSGRSHHSDPRYIGLESRYPSGTATGLAERGHLVGWTDDFDPYFGQAQIVLRDPETGLLQGGADPRAEGAALGF